jgi:hypothetical protein
LADEARTNRLRKFCEKNCVARTTLGELTAALLGMAEQTERCRMAQATAPVLDSVADVPPCICRLVVDIFAKVQNYLVIIFPPKGDLAADLCSTVKPTFCADSKSVIPS